MSTLVVRWLALPPNLRGIVWVGLSGLLFALLNVSLADAGIYCWIIKFHYGFWRPITAIDRADEDGNADTDADPRWEPLLETPPFPSYTSGHSTFSGAGASLLAHFFGTDRMQFATTSDGLPGVTRRFESIWSAAEGMMSSLTRSLMPSASVCSQPNLPPTRVGPSRS